MNSEQFPIDYATVVLIRDKLFSTRKELNFEILFR
jgi:hypothetical protein